MASNWGNKESLEEARRFLSEVSGKRGGRGPQGRGGGGGPSRPPAVRPQPNIAFNGNSHVGQGGASQSAWGGGGGDLATAPPSHPFFNSRSAPKTNSGVGTGGQNPRPQAPTEDRMDIDELPQALNSGMTGSHWGPVHNTIATGVTPSAPAKVVATTIQPASGPTMSQFGHGMVFTSAPGPRSPSPKLGMGASRWAAGDSPTASNKLDVHAPSFVPAMPIKTIIDNDWQTTYRYEEQGYFFKVAANNAQQAGDMAAEQQLRKIEKLFHDIVEARHDQDGEKERAALNAAQAAIKLAAPVLNTYKKAKPVQKAQGIGPLTNAATARQNDRPPLETMPVQSSNHFAPQPAQSFRPMQPMPRAPVPAPTGASTLGSFQGMAGKTTFDDPEAMRLLADFMNHRGN